MNVSSLSNLLGRYTGADPSPVDSCTNAAGYHQQARVENAFFRFKTIGGDRLRARSEAGRRVEARIACDVLNRMTELGRPESIAIGP